MLKYSEIVSHHFFLYVVNGHNHRLVMAIRNHLSKKRMSMVSNMKEKVQEAKKNVSLFISNIRSVNSPEFNTYNNRNILKRLHIVSITLIIVYAYYFLADYFLLTNIDNITYRNNLIIIHLATFFISIVYLFIYRRVILNESFLLSYKSTLLINLYIICYLLLGATSSINSQSLTGNIDSYITIVIGIAVLFHVRPAHLLSIYLVAHLMFIFGLFMTIQDFNELITKQVNSTATVIIALSISIAFYTYRKNAFYHRISLKEKEDSFKKLFEVNPFPLVLTSMTDGGIVEVNERALQFYGVSKDELSQYKAADFYKSNEERIPVIKELKRSGHVRNHIIEQKAANGQYKWVLLNYELVDYANEKCILTGVTDVTDLKKIEAELIRHATYDTLTGIHNRRSGLMLLSDLNEKAKAAHDPFVLCFIDVNNLKVVNDKYGHGEGDFLIKRVCTIINEFIGEQDIFFRYGGDEFIIVFSQNDLNEVTAIWTEIVSQLSSDVQLRKKPYPVSVSHGLYLYDTKENISIEDMIDKADQEMYREKDEIKRGIS